MAQIVCVHQLSEGFVQESGIQATCHLASKRAHLLINKLLFVAVHSCRSP